MMLVAAVQDFDDRYRADTCVMTTQTMPRSQSSVSEGLVPTASQRLDLLGGWDKNAPGDASSEATGTEHCLASSSVLAWSHGHSAKAACD
ncbi:MAG TPA: hypothetical protein VMG37_21720 [Solirubrobacteraceae bacterium]|nr:hypothetical protein [Solirubrobacteraceae bacterium]